MTPDDKLVSDLGDFIAEKRDAFSHVSNDIDSWELADEVLNWLQQGGYLGESGYILDDNPDV